MTKEEYFGEWLKVLPQKEMAYALDKVRPYMNSLCPAFKDIFKAFRLCPYSDLRVVILGQDPYPNSMATGLAFANPKDTIQLSPSLEIIKESMINYEFPAKIINFAVDLESWAEQGVLLLNSALTCEKGKPGVHLNIWRPFISQLLTNLGNTQFGMIYVLMGEIAGTFEPYIKKFGNFIIRTRHPAYYARSGTQMPDIWSDINNILEAQEGHSINFYTELLW